MLHTGSQMLRLWAPGLVWLVFILNTVSECTLGVNTACEHERYRKTCVETEYDIREAVCCDSSLYHGVGLSCCGKKAFNPAEATCCKVEDGYTATANVTEGLSERVSSCCWLRAYNSLNEICCETAVIAKPSPKAQCCGKEAFDEDKQMCCGPIHKKIVLARVSRHHQCCGHDHYNTKTHCCCVINETLEIQLINSSCCAQESEAFDGNKHIHCGPSHNKTILLRKSSHHQCCGRDQYDTGTHCCCLMNEALEIHPIDSRCCLKESALCGTEAYNTLNKLCCQSTVVAKPAEKATCCGKKAFDEDKQMCCGPIHKKIILARVSRHHQCCGHDQYNTKTHCCCLINETLEIQLINSSCCVRESGPGLGVGNMEQPKKGWKPTAGEEDWGQNNAAPTVYNPRARICCDGHVSEWKPGTNQFKGSPGLLCCGTEVYQPNTEICCNGRRHQKVEKNMYCCGVQAYSLKNRQMKCCAGTLYNLTLFGKLEHEARCCGAILQKPPDVCCSCGNKDVLYSAKTGFRCCGHLYYNTSLWSCCAERLSPVHQTVGSRNKMSTGLRLESVNNLNEDLCKKMFIGTVESVSLHGIVFSSVLKIHGRNSKVKPLPSPYFLKAPDQCNAPQLIPWKTYFFDKDNVFTDSNHGSVLQSLHFILSKCNRR